MPGKAWAQFFAYRSDIVQDNKGNDIVENPKLKNCTDTNLYAKKKLPWLPAQWTLIKS